MVEYWVAVSEDNAAVLTENPYTFEVSEDVTLVPVFVNIPTQYTIAVNNGQANVLSAVADEPDDCCYWFNYCTDCITHQKTQEIK